MCVAFYVLFLIQSANGFHHFTSGYKRKFVLTAVSVPNPSVWSVFGDIAANLDVSNLGQGFPDWSPPQFVLDALKETVTEKSINHQYTRPSGHVSLVRLLADAYANHLNRVIDPFSEVVVTVGASQALYLLFQTIPKRFDEVVGFEDIDSLKIWIWRI